MEDSKILTGRNFQVLKKKNMSEGKTGRLVTLVSYVSVQLSAN